MKRMKILAVATLALTLVALPQTAAAQQRGKAADPNSRNRTRTGDSNFPAEQVQRETKKLPIGASGALELENISGDIIVTAAAGQEATVEIVRTSRGRTDADARTGLDRVTVGVEQGPNRARVRTNYPDENGRQNYRVSVAFTVSAPPGTRLSVESVGGNVRVTGIRGQLTAETVGGDVTIADGGQVLSVHTVGGEISVSGAQSDGTLEASSVGGNVVIQQAKVKRVSISTVGGGVTARDVTCESADLGAMGGAVEFSGPIAKGGRYELHAQSGDVKFVPAGEGGYELQARTFSGDIRTDVPLKVQGTVSGRVSRREIRGTVGDGSAVVIARTFSGDVIVGKK